MNKRAELKLRDPDFVAIPLTRTELEMLAGLWDHNDQFDHEDLSIWLKAKGALVVLTENQSETEA